MTDLAKWQGWETAGSRNDAEVTGWKEPFRESLPFSNPPSPFPGSIGIINLEKIREVIYGLQSLGDKILSHKELRSEIGSPSVYASIAEGEFLSQGQVNMAESWF